MRPLPYSEHEHHTNITKTLYAGCLQTLSSVSGIKANPLADEDLLAVDVGVEAEELLQGQPGGLRHGEACLPLLHPVHLVADQRRHRRDCCVRQGDRDKETRDHKSGRATVRHCKYCARQGMKLAT